MTPTTIDIVKLSLDTTTWKLSFDLSWILLLVVAATGVIGVLLKKFFFRGYALTKLKITLGGIGDVELSPNAEDLQIAHKIWTQLVTRKAAISIDVNHDVIVEIYDSWYALFGEVRSLISNIPAKLIRRSNSTKLLVDVATKTLNDGLRPHLTKWQAKFRSWYAAHKDELQTKSPQEVQASYPEYHQLVTDMMAINQQLILYSLELKKIVDGK